MRIRLTWIVGTILLSILIFTQSAWEEKMPIIPILLYITGLHLAGIAALGRLWCSLYIGGHKDSTLIQLGPYSLCRNPLYFFSFIGAIGVGMATETFTMPLLLGVSFLLYYPSVIRKEEEKLQTLFPDQFDDYCAKIPRFFPDHIEFEEPKSCKVNPRIYRKHIPGSLMFILIVGWLKAFEELHEMGVLPVYFHLY